MEQWPARKAEVIHAVVQLERYLKTHPSARKENGGGNCVDLPFLCQLCSEHRFDLEMIDGDGYPICKRCIDIIAGTDSECGVIS